MTKWDTYFVVLGFLPARLRVNMHKKIITDIIVRFRDIDSMGHVDNAVFFTYFEEGRKKFLRLLFNIVKPEEYNFILAHISCDFLNPIKISDPISLQLWVGEICQRKFDGICNSEPR